MKKPRYARFLDNILIPLEGDKIIQIGTTVHLYGSDKIVYKNIVSLDLRVTILKDEVISCKTEKELLNKWKDVMNNLIVILLSDTIYLVSICYILGIEPRS